MRTKANNNDSARLARLEEEMENLRAEVHQYKQSGWRAIVGGHRDSTTFDEVVRAMRKHRREDYDRARGARRRRRARRKAIAAEE